MQDDFDDGMDLPDDDVVEEEVTITEMEYTVPDEIDLEPETAEPAGRMSGGARVRPSGPPRMAAPILPVPAPAAKKPVATKKQAKPAKKTKAAPKKKASPKKKAAPKGKKKAAAKKKAAPRRKLSKKKSPARRTAKKKKAGAKK
jgi:colicin import membrane protein